jgi:hypothetical protein
VHIKKILQAHAASKANVVQFTIKTQEISKSFSLRPITSSSQNQSLLSRNAPIEVLGCLAFPQFCRHSS